MLVGAATLALAVAGGCPHDLTRGGADGAGAQDVGGASDRGTDRATQQDMAGVDRGAPPVDWAVILDLPGGGKLDRTGPLTDLPPPLDKALPPPDKALPPPDKAPPPPDLPLPPPDKALPKPDKKLPPPDLPPPPPDLPLPKPDKGFVGCKSCYTTWGGCAIKCNYPAGNTTLTCTKSTKNYNCKVTGHKCGKVNYCGGGSAIGSAGGCTWCNKAKGTSLCWGYIKKGGC